MQTQGSDGVTVPIPPVRVHTGRGIETNTFRGGVRIYFAYRCSIFLLFHNYQISIHYLSHAAAPPSNGEGLPLVILTLITISKEYSVIIYIYRMLYKTNIWMVGPEL